MPDWSCRKVSGDGSWGRKEALKYCRGDLGEKRAKELENRVT